MSNEEDDEVSQRKTFDDLSDKELLVYGILPEDGITKEGIVREIEERMEYTEILDALKVLLDSELVEVTTRGGHTIYRRVEKG